MYQNGQGTATFKLGSSELPEVLVSQGLVKGIRVHQLEGLW